MNTTLCASYMVCFSLQDHQQLSQVIEPPLSVLDDLATPVVTVGSATDIDFRTTTWLASKSCCENIKSNDVITYLKPSSGLWADILLH